MELISAILDKIEYELFRCYWNKNQEEMSSPFKNTGTTYSNDYFTVRAYSWNEDNTLPNFESEFLKCWWYKHSNRGLTYKINYNQYIDKVDQLNTFLINCLESIRKDFEG